MRREHDNTVREEGKRGLGREEHGWVLHLGSGWFVQGLFCFVLDLYFWATLTRDDLAPGWIWMGWTTGEGHDATTVNIRVDADAERKVRNTSTVLLLSSEPLRQTHRRRAPVLISGGMRGFRRRTHTESHSFSRCRQCLSRVFWASKEASGWPAHVGRRTGRGVPMGMSPGLARLSVPFIVPVCPRLSHPHLKQALLN